VNLAKDPFALLEGSRSEKDKSEGAISLFKQILVFVWFYLQCLDVQLSSASKERGL